jgi:hypothetical protein
VVDGEFGDPLDAAAGEDGLLDRGSPSAARGTCGRRFGVLPFDVLPHDDDVDISDAGQP